MLLRKQLEIHLGYWRAVNRIRTGRDDEQRLEDYGAETYPQARGTELVTRATNAGGANGLESQDLAEEIESVGGVFLAQNCRLVRGRLDLSGFDTLSLNGSSLVSLALAAVEVGTFDASHLRACSGTIAVESGSARFYQGLFRFATITVRSSDADFGDADLAIDSARARPDLLDLAASFGGIGLEERERDDPNRFVDCDFPGVSFRDALLQGATFSNCAMPGADVTEANLDDVSFERCDLSDISFELAASTDRLTVDGQPLVIDR